MEKLKLKVEEIEVSTFASGAPEPLPRGTVDAHFATQTCHTSSRCCPATSQLQCSVTGLCG